MAASERSPFSASPAQRALLYAALVALCVIFAFPLLWMMLSSLKTPAETLHVPPIWFPASPSLAAFVKMSDVINLPRSLMNSALIAGITTAGILVSSLMAGYAFTKHRFPGRDLLFAAIIATMFLPPIVTLIPLYRMIEAFRLDGHLAGVILPNLANAFGIFLMRQFVAGVPDELIEAARVDGASELLIVFRIVAPSVTPALAALGLFAFVYHWNSYLWPLTVLQGSDDQYPIVLSLSRLLSYNRSAINTNLVMAGATMAVLPPLLLFVLLQRSFVKTIVSSGLKG